MQIIKTELYEIDWNCFFGGACEAESPLCGQFKGRVDASHPAVIPAHMHRYCVIHVGKQITIKRHVSNNPRSERSYGRR